MGAAPKIERTGCHGFIDNAKQKTHTHPLTTLVICVLLLGGLSATLACVNLNFTAKLIIGCVGGAVIITPFLALRLASRNLPTPKTETDSSVADSTPISSHDLMMALASRFTKKPQILKDGEEVSFDSTAFIYQKDGDTHLGINLINKMTKIVQRLRISRYYLPLMASCPVRAYYFSDVPAGFFQDLSPSVHDAFVLSAELNSNFSLVSGLAEKLKKNNNTWLGALKDLVDGKNPNYELFREAE